MNDYIFCPLCGSMAWTIDRSTGGNDTRTEHHGCIECQKFSYTNTTILSHIDPVTNICYFSKTRKSETAVIGPYFITILFNHNFTSIRYAKDLELILSLDQVIPFDWYKGDDLLEKINTYMVFS